MKQTISFYKHRIESNNEQHLEKMKPKSIHSKLIPLAALMVVGQTALAQTKLNTNSLQANATNWSVAPSTTATGTFDATISAVNAASLTLGGVDLSIGRLTFGATMNGPVNIAGGNTITLNNGTAISAASSNQNITINAPVVITAAGNTFEADNTLATTLTFNNTITSATHPIVWRAGTGVFAGGGSYSALTVHSRTGITSTVKLGADNGIATNAQVTIGINNGSAQLDLAGYNQSLTGITKGGSSPATIGNSSTTSDSVLTLTGTSSYSGTIQDSISSGNRKVGVTINGGALTLGANNTYSGDTIIKAGSLKLDGSGNLSNSQNIIIGDAGSSGAVLDVTTKTTGFTVGASQTLGGIGHLNAAGKTVTINGGIAPGNSAGKLNVTTTALSFGAGSLFSAELTRGVTPSAGLNYDQLDVVGSVVIDSSAILSLSALGSGGWNVNDLFFLILNDGEDAISGTFSGYGEGSTFLLGSQSFMLTYQGDSGTQSFTGGNDLAVMAIPEPSSALMGGLGLLMLLRKRR